MEKKILSFGEILYDMIEGKPHLGGTSLNFAFYARQFSIGASILSSVGKDPLGKKAVASIKKAGIDASLVGTVKNRTGYVTVKLDAGQPSFIIHKNVAWDHIALPEKVPYFDMLYFGTLSQRSPGNRRTLQALIAKKPRHIFFDVNMRQSFYSKKTLSEGLACATIVKFNEDEWAKIKKMFSLKAPSNIIDRFGCEYVIVTKGAKGAEVFSDKCGIYVKAPRVKVVDAVGAGDAFSGAFAAGILCGIPLKAIMKKAALTGAFVVTKRGAQNVLPRKLKHI